ncbi:hypothetical protein PENTCL1PPCAC_12441, partial [Pristionchus entomophagus]
TASGKDGEDENAASGKDGGDEPSGDGNHYGSGGPAEEDQPIDDQPASSGDGKPAGSEEFAGSGQNGPTASGFEEITGSGEGQLAYTGVRGLASSGEAGIRTGVTGIRFTQISNQSGSRLLSNISDEIRYERKLRQKLKEMEEKELKAEENAKRSSINYKPEHKPMFEYARSGPSPNTIRVGKGGVSTVLFAAQNHPRMAEDAPVDSDAAQLREQVNQQPKMTRVTKKCMRKTVSKLSEMATDMKDKLPTPLMEQIIVYDVEHNEYRIRRPETWPAIVNRRSKLIAVAGTKGSGRTTLSHSLIYEYGYSLSKDQAMASRIGVGVIMYVLEQPGVVILDIADSMDNSDEKSSPLGPALLELFGYINCDHVVYNMPVHNHDEDLSEEGLVSWIENRIRILFESAQVVRLFGASKISIVLRPAPPDEKENERVEREVSGFIKIITEDANSIAAQLNSSKGGSENTPSQQEASTKEVTSKYLRTVMHNVAAFRLPYLEPDSLNAWEKYHDALKPINERLEKCTAYHATADIPDEKEYGGPRSIVDTMIHVWNALQRSTDIQNTFTAAATWSGQEREAREEPDKPLEKMAYSIKAYQEELKKMRKTLSVHAECVNLIEDLKRLEDELKFQAKNEQHLKEQDRDQFMFIRYILSTASKILPAARNFSALSCKELALRVGLHGLTCLFGNNRESRTMDAIAVRFCLIDFGILRHLADPEVYRNYSDCWKFLWYAAKCGYKIRLAEFPTVEAAKEILSRVDERAEPLLVHTYACLFVVSMLREEVDLTTLSQRDVSSEADGKAISHERMLKLEMGLRVGLKKDAQRIIQEIHEKSLPNGTQQLLDLPRNWFNRRMAQNFKITYDEIDSRHRNDCMQVAFEVASEEIARATASELVLCVDNWLTITNETPTELSKQQLRVLIECANHASADDAIFIELYKNTADKLIKLRKTITDDDVNQLIERALINLMNAEYKRKTVSLEHQKKKTRSIREDIRKIMQEKETIVQKVHDMNELKLRDRREKQLARYGYIRLHCMENGLGIISLKRLLAHESGQPLLEKHQSTLITFVDAFVVTAYDDEDREKYIEPIMEQRGNIIRTIFKMVAEAAEKLNGVTEDTESYDASSLLIVKAGCSLYNELLHKFHRHNLEDFYDAGKREKQSNVHGLHLAAEIEQTPSFESILDALAVVNRSLIARRSILRMSGRGEHSDAVHQTVVKAVISLLNASSTCGISFGTVLSELQREDRGKAFVATLKDISEPEKLHILLHHTDLAELKPNKNDFWRMNILRAAYLIYIGDKSEEKSLTVARTVTLAAVEESISGSENVIKQEEHIKQQIKQLEIEESQLDQSTSGLATGTGDGQLVAHAQLRSITPDKRITSLSLTKESIGDGLAVEGVFLSISSYKYRKSSGIDYAACDSHFGLGGSCALRLLVSNPQSNHQIIAKLRDHLERCKEERTEPLRMRKNNQMVQNMMQLVGSREAFEATGHEEFDDIGEGFWIFDQQNIDDKHRQALNDFTHWHDEWTGQSSVIRLHSHFELCNRSTQPGRDALLRQTLPSEFFKENHAELASMTLRALIERRSRDKSMVKTGYVLVRIKLREDRLVQAIFHDVSSEESVLGELRKLDPLVASVEWITTSSKHSNMKDSISMISSLAIYGLAQY